MGRVKKGFQTYNDRLYGDKVIHVFFFSCYHTDWKMGYFLTWRVLLGVPISLEPRRAACCKKDTKNRLNAFDLAKNDAWGYFKRLWVGSKRHVWWGHLLKAGSCCRTQAGFWCLSAVGVHGRWGAISRYYCCCAPSSRWPLVSLLSFPIFGLDAVRLWSTPPKFKHIPIKDIVVGEPLLVKQISK